MRFFVTISAGDIVLLMNQIVEVGVVYCSVVLSQYKRGMEVGRGSLSYFLALDGGLIIVLLLIPLEIPGRRNRKESHPLQPL